MKISPISTFLVLLAISSVTTLSSCKKSPSDVLMEPNDNSPPGIEGTGGNTGPQGISTSGIYDIVLHEEYYCWVCDSAEYYSDTTVYWSAEIPATPGSLTIPWHTGPAKSFDVSSNGTIAKCGNTVGALNGNTFEVNFSDDVCGTGAQSATYFFDVTATRQ